MVFRVYTERKKGFEAEAKSLLSDIRELLGIASVEEVRVVNRYDAEGISEENFLACVPTVFSEPQTDNAFFELSAEGYSIFAVEYLPGQFDQRADSCAQCIQLACGGERPTVRSGKVSTMRSPSASLDLVSASRSLPNCAKD